MNRWKKAGITGLIVAGVAGAIAAFGFASLPLLIASGIGGAIFGLGPIAVGYAKDLYDNHKARQNADILTVYQATGDTPTHQAKPELSTTSTISNTLTNSPKTQRQESATVASQPTVKQGNVVAVDFQKKPNTAQKIWNSLTSFFGHHSTPAPVADAAPRNSMRKTG